MTHTKKSNLIEITCIDCGMQGRFTARSPAAPMLTASQESHKKGWSYEHGYFAMLTNSYKNRCPDCTKKINDDKT